VGEGVGTGEEVGEGDTLGDGDGEGEGDGLGDGVGVGVETADMKENFTPSMGMRVDSPLAAVVLELLSNSI
jgi:hypothetical protein